MYCMWLVEKKVACRAVLRTGASVGCELYLLAGIRCGRELDTEATCCYNTHVVHVGRATVLPFTIALSHA